MLKLGKYQTIKIKGVSETTFHNDFKPFFI